MKSQMKHPMKHTNPNKIGLTALVLTAAVFVASAYSAYLYWQDDQYSVGVLISITVMSVTAMSILALAWTLGRYKNAEERSKDVVFLRMVRGPRRTFKEEFSRPESYTEDRNLKGPLNQ